MNHKITTTYGKAGVNSIPKAQAHCSCGWTSRRVPTVTDAAMVGEKHVATADAKVDTTRINTGDQS